MPFLDLTGQRFGRLLVLRKDDQGRSKDGRSFTTWLCRCDCGEAHIVKGKNLTTSTPKNQVRSCGCLRGDRIRETSRDRNYEAEWTDKEWPGAMEAVRELEQSWSRIIHFGVLTKDDYEETEETERPPRRTGVPSENPAPKLCPKGSGGDGSGDGKTEAVGATKQGVTT